MAFARRMPTHVAVNIAQGFLRIRGERIEIVPVYFQDDNFSLGPQVSEGDAKRQSARRPFSECHHTQIVDPNPESLIVRIVERAGFVLILARGLMAHYDDFCKLLSDGKGRR